MTCRSFGRKGELLGRHAENEPTEAHHAVVMVGRTFPRPCLAGSRRRAGRRAHRVALEELAAGEARRDLCRGAARSAAAAAVAVVVCAAAGSPRYATGAEPD